MEGFRAASEGVHAIAAYWRVSFMSKPCRLQGICLVVTVLASAAAVTAPVSAADAGSPAAPVAISLGRGATLSMMDTGLATPGYKLTGSKEKALTIGWWGASEEKTGAVLNDLGMVAGKHITMVHPAWKAGHGALYVDYPMAWPSGAAKPTSGAANPVCR